MTTPEQHNEPTNLTSYRLSMIEKTLEAIRDNLTQLAQLEQKHIETREALGRAFAAIEGQDGRLRTVEQEMPTLRLVRGWVISGVIGIMGLLAVTVFKLFTFKV
jgi:hypothetical protein